MKTSPMIANRLRPLEHHHFFAQYTCITRKKRWVSALGSCLGEEGSQVAAVFHLFFTGRLWRDRVPALDEDDVEP